MESNLFEVLRKPSDGQSEQIFLRVPDGEPLTYSEFFKMSGRYSTALHACGVKEGDRVLVKVEKSIDALALYLACLQSGAIYVPSNPRNTVEETEYLSQDAEPSLVVVSHGCTQSVNTRSETIGKSN